MAPVGRNRPFNGEKREPISPIDDLDSANTSISEVKRSVSINNAIVVRPAKLYEKAKENEDLVLAETLAVQGKINSEDSERALEDRSQLDLEYEEISCLCGVDISQKKNQSVSTSTSTSFLVSFPSNSVAKSWKSSGKGKKRKNKSGFNKKKVHKRPRVDISMSAVNDSMEKIVIQTTTDSDKKINTVNNTQGIVSKNCTKTAGDPHKTGTKNGCVTTQQPAPVAAGGICCNVQGTRGGGGGGGGGGDDGEGKPPRKPPEVTQSNKAGKKTKKKKTSSNDMEVDSEESLSEGKTPIKAPLPVSFSKAQEHHVAKESSEMQEGTRAEMMVSAAGQQKNVIKCQPVVPPTQQIVMILNSAINHHNFCTKRPCVRCYRVEAMIKHSLEETNGSCKCAKVCQLWSHVLTFHTGICKFHGCKVCKNINKPLAEPSPAPAVSQKKLNVATCGQSLDEEVVWKNAELPGDLTHFREDKDYFLCKGNSVVGKGAHGEVCNVEVLDNVKLKYFSSCCNDLVLKKTLTLEDDEKYVFEKTSKHPNFVNTYLAVKKNEPNNVHHRIFMEKCETSLKDYLKKLVNEGKQMEIWEAMFYWTQIVVALRYLHSKLQIPVIHKDIKAENVLLDVKTNLVRAKLADYDTVKKLHNKWTKPGLSPKGTPGLISPEVLRGEVHGRPSDMWNVAMFLLQLLFPVGFVKLQVAIKALKLARTYVPDTEKLVQTFLEEAIPALKKMDSDLGDLIERCLNKEDQEARPTANEVLEHRAVTKYQNMNMKIDMAQLIGKICPKGSCAATS